MDLIERQAAIDVVKGIDSYFVKYIEELPSAQPDLESAYQEGYTAAESKYRAMMDGQPDLDEWCTDCKEYDQKRHCCPRWNRVIRNALKDAQPERKKGEWIYCDDDDVRYDTYHCSVCEKHFTVDAERFCDIGFVRDDLRYCPNCGSYNGGKKK